MAELPSDVLFNIFSRLPVKSLARCRCVSKQWCECINDPYLAIIHGERSSPEEPKPIIYYGHSNPPCIVSFHITKSNETMTLLEDKINPHKQFRCTQSSRATMVRGSCNGLIYASQDHVLDKLSLVVIHPVRKECHELPPIDPYVPWPYNPVTQKSSCGLGFDASTNTFKMVCVLSSVDQAHPDTRRMTQCTMVHVLGTNSWRKMPPKLPPLSITGDGVFADGCLYWLNKGAVHPLVTCFDVKEEEFRLITRPKTTGISWMLSLRFVELLDLHGEVGYSIYHLNNKIEVWVLKEKQWVIRYVIHLQLPFYAEYYYIKIGRWNNEGDVLIQIQTPPGAKVRWFVYSLKRELLDEVKIVHEDGKYNKYIYMYPAGNLLSILGINTNIAL
ncbi:hypothetical protein E3N88_01308 [Mikania micrantha]|uniref:F-box domain-containing protein n=1 Tax=Mikania micrantha TaxID=192012 RepID=A0A5N6Q0V3_9ASTR|nr:hypothetical protein E3N88_01308 [Mikania micrantha]